ncbi:MAG: aldehyde dehydrogenase family protein, partial [Phyllobacteriaceae bacterium]|nr:aldehyde dehydrogenase family protein [Phyllobacteriaceae bacterium]
MVKTINHWIDGKQVKGSGTRKSAVFNPATGEQTGELILATTAEMDVAVQGARAAFPAWASTT